jgi:hypothetical protein
MTIHRRAAWDRCRVMIDVRKALCLCVVLMAFAFSGSVGLADSPSPPPMPGKDPNAAGGADAAAPEQVFDPMNPKVSEATALAIQQVLHRLEALKAREPRPPEPWAKEMIPDDSVTKSNRSLKRYFSRNVALGGMAPTELRERLRHLAFTGRISKTEYSELREEIINSWKNDIMNWPGCLNYYAPEDVEYRGFRFGNGFCF